MRACERKGASTESERDVRSGRPIRRGQTGRCICGMRTTERPIRRGAAADACGMRTNGHTRGRGCPAGRLQQQRVPSRAPTGSRGCPAERLTAAPRQRRYLPDLGGDTCLSATAPARSCDLCPQHKHVFRRALGEFGGSGRVPGRVPAPATPGDVSSYDMAVGRGHVITMQCFDAPATSCRVLSGRSTTNLASRFTGPPQTLSLLEQRMRRLGR